MWVEAGRLEARDAENLEPDTPPGVGVPGASGVTPTGLGQAAEALTPHDHTRRAQVPVHTLTSESLTPKPRATREFSVLPAPGPWRTSPGVPMVLPVALCRLLSCVCRPWGWLCPTRPLPACCARLRPSSPDQPEACHGPLALAWRWRGPGVALRVRGCLHRLSSPHASSAQPSWARREARVSQLAPEGPFRARDR